MTMNEYRTLDSFTRNEIRTDFTLYRAETGDRTVSFTLYVSWLDFETEAGCSIEDYKA